MSGEDRDATLSHIIHELRDYKKRLVEQIDASRATETTHDDDHVRGRPSTPPAPICLTSTVSNGCVVAACRPRKELPDLVRSSIPSVVGTTKPAAGGRPAAIWNPALSVSYSVDACGALDLTTSPSRPAIVTSVEPPPPQSSEMVLDLSCRRRQRASLSPPPMTSSVGPEVESASSRSRRHNRKLSAGSAASGRHDDHDNPLRWSVRDVIEFVSEVPGCQTYAEVCILVFQWLLQFIFQLSK